MNSGVHKVQPNGATGEEWFATNIETVKAAIKAVKNAKPFLKIDKPLYIYDKNGNYTEEILKIYNKK